MTITTKAGDGGDGVVRWHREKYKPKGGPSGGNGGRGGDVYLRAVRDLSILSSYRHNPHFAAENGKDGASENRHGHNGDDVYVDVPVGAVVTNAHTGEQYEFLHEGQTVHVASGGVGGYGNTHFKSSRNVRPMESTPGKPGEEVELQVEVRLIADAGFVGYPNAGKSTLLNELTNAHAKIGHYAFTTLDPNLGDFHGHILADIPGLIEGAASGRGLGHKFLKHIQRTKMLIHCISFERENLQQSHNMIREELAEYDPSLLEKREIIVLTKSDTVDEATREEGRAAFEALGRTVYTVSIADPDSVERFAAGLSTFLSEQ